MGSAGATLISFTSSPGAMSGTDVGYNFPETSPVTRPPQKLHRTASRNRPLSLHVVQSSSFPLPLSIDLSFKHKFLESFFAYPARANIKKNCIPSQFLTRFPSMNRLLRSQSNALKLVSNQFPKMFSQSAPLQRSAVIFDIGWFLLST